MEKSLRFGISGLTRGSHFLDALHSWDDTVLAAVYDPDPARCAQLTDQIGDACFCKSYTELLDSGIDAVIVASPMYLHTPQSIAAFERDIHIFSEVSAATSLDQCRELVRAARASQATYMMGENCCFMKPFALVKNMLRAGLFGDVYYAEGEYVHEVRPFPGSERWRDQWLFGRRGAPYITHPLGTVLHWLDDRVVSVNCVGSGAWIDSTKGNDDSSIMLCRTSRGALVKIRHDEMSPRPSSHNYAGIQGTGGAYEAMRHPDDNHRVCLHTPDSDPKQRSWQSLWDFEDEYLPEFWKRAAESDDAHGGSDALTLRSFVDSVLNDTPPLIDIYRALDFTVPGLISEISVQQGGVPVAVPDFRFM